MRNRFTRNEIVPVDDYAEIILYDKNQNEKARTKIDVDDIEKVYPLKWYAKVSRLNKLYAQSRTGRIQLSHFVIDFIKDDEDLYVDHINGDSLDNRKNNLRICTHQENMMNQRVIPSNNTSGYIGVTLDRRNGNWISQIKVNGKHIHLGCFSDIRDAIEIRKKAELKYFAHNKFLNFED